MQNTLAKLCSGFNAGVYCKNVHLATKPRFGKMHKYGDRDRTLFCGATILECHQQKQPEEFFFKCFVYPP